jgi:S1-C subfamily serine protease
MYLRPSRQFDHPDLCDLSGLHFLRQDGVIIVDKVERYSPAATADVQENDVLLAVNGRETSKARLFPLRRLLSTPHKTVRLELRRGKQEFEVSLMLPASPIEPDADRDDDGAAPPQKSAEGPDRRPKRGSTR